MGYSFKMQLPFYVSCLIILLKLITYHDKALYSWTVPVLRQLKATTEPSTHCLGRCRDMDLDIWRYQKGQKIRAIGWQ